MNNIIKAFVPLISAIILASCAADNAPASQNGGGTTQTAAFHTPARTEEVIFDQIYYGKVFPTVDRPRNTERASISISRPIHIPHSSAGTAHGSFFTLTINIVSITMTITGIPVFTGYMITEPWTKP